MGIYKTEHFGIARKIVANMTSQSWEEIPHAAMGYEADVTDMMKVIKQLNEGVTDKSKKISINTVMLKIICEGLKAAPKMNTTIKFNRKLVRGTVYYHDEINISMPMILHTGEMMTVNMRDMGNKSLSEMTASIHDTIRRANNSDMNEVMFEVSMDNTIKGLKNGKIAQTVCRLIGSKTPGKHMVKTLSGEARKKYYSIPQSERLTKRDIEQGTTTVSNLGSIHRTQNGFATLIEIIPPQTTAFAINAVQDRAVVVTGADGRQSIEIRRILPITIVTDHRALDYGDCVPFANRLDEIFERPEVIFSWLGDDEKASEKESA